jgi:hypothetical protein
MLEWLIMSLKQSRKDNFYAVILNTDHFAETITLIRPGEINRDLVAVVQHEEDREASAVGEDRVEKLRVRCGNDETFPVKSGIADPRIGDSLLRENDPRPFSFQGRIYDTTPHSWALEFTRRVPEQVGAKR